MKSLYARLSIVFLLILLTLGSLILWLAQRSAQAYFLEFTQQLNSPISMYMAQNANLAIADGLNSEALVELSPHIMMINPSVEVYLLDAQGAVVAHSLDPTPIVLDRVSLDPIKQFLSAERRFPLFGDNPKNKDKQHIFSAHPLTNGHGTIGYVYVVLAGKNHETLLASIAGSHTIKTLAITISCILLLALLTGCIIFFMLTHRLRKLTRNVQHWQHNSNSLKPLAVTQARSELDEIDELNLAYESMAGNLTQQCQMLEQNDQNRRDLFANISHDLRTPLTTLQGYLETLLLKQKRLSPEQQRHYIKVAHKQSKRLRRLVTQLFELSKLNSGEFKLEMEVFSVFELAHDSVQVFEMQAQRKSIQIQVTTDTVDGRTLNVYADIALIHRVFENLLGNAIRFTPAKGRIDVSLARTSTNRISVTIRDTGIGMSVNEALHVFERHYTPASSEQRDSGHAGLGLAIVQSILDLHECNIAVRSAPDEGTSFYFELPAGRLQTSGRRLMTA